MKKWSSIIVVMVASVGVWGQPFKVAGSDILAPVIENAIVSLAKASGIDVESNMRGTFLAMPELKEGKCDVAIIAKPRNQRIPDGLVALPLAYQTAVVIVNTVNPIEEITTKQLTDIYSKNAKVRSENWSQLGVNDASLRNIVAVSTAFGDNLVVELFKAEALDGSNFGIWIKMLQKKSDVINVVKTNNAAIAVVGKAENIEMIKVLPVSKSDGGKAYAYKPDATSIFNGDYPLTLPFYIVFKKENLKKVKPLLKILLDDKIATLLDNSDFYSAPKNSRKKSIFELDIIK